MFLGDDHHRIPQFNHGAAVRNDDLPFPDNGADQDVLLQPDILQRHAHQVGDTLFHPELDCLHLVAHQMVQGLLADMEIQTTAARALLWHCARMVDEGVYDSKLGAVTKAFISDAAMQVTTNAVQVLGGYGYSREYPVEKLMRDAKLWQIFEGTNQVQRMVIASHLGVK